MKAIKVLVCLLWCGFVSECFADRIRQECVVYRDLSSKEVANVIGAVNDKSVYGLKVCKAIDFQIESHFLLTQITNKNQVCEYFELPVPADDRQPRHFMVKEKGGCPSPGDQRYVQVDQLDSDDFISLVNLVEAMSSSEEEFKDKVRKLRKDSIKGMPIEDLESLLMSNEYRISRASFAGKSFLLNAYYILLVASNDEDLVIEIKFSKWLGSLRLVGVSQLE